MDGACFKRTVVRRKPKVSYKYFYEKSNREVKDLNLLKKLNSVIVPHTYTNVCIYPSNKDLQATGNDGTGRKQYFYSKEHKETVEQEKFCNLIYLGKKLPQILKDMDSLLSKGQRGNVDQNVIDALALKIMITCNFRVGNNNNRRKYQTYGLTTMTRNHLRFENSGKVAHIKFPGKKQQTNECFIKDIRTVNFLKKIASYQSKLEKTDYRPILTWNGFKVTPESLNGFLSNYHPEITTKTWRTWFANITYIEKATQIQLAETKTARKRQSNAIIKEIASDLHHTVAINKKNYLNKELTELFVEHPEIWENLKKKKRSSNQFLLLFLQSYCKAITGEDKPQRTRSRKQTRSRRKSRQ